MLNKAIKMYSLILLFFLLFTFSCKNIIESEQNSSFLIKIEINDFGDEKKIFYYDILSKKYLENDNHTSKAVTQINVPRKYFNVYYRSEFTLSKYSEIVNFEFLGCYDTNDNIIIDKTGKFVSPIINDYNATIVAQPKWSVPRVTLPTYLADDNYDFLGWAETSKINSKEDLVLMGYESSFCPDKTTFLYSIFAEKLSIRLHHNGMTENINTNKYTPVELRIPSVWGLPRLCAGWGEQPNIVKYSIKEIRKFNKTTDLYLVTEQSEISFGELKYVRYNGLIGSNNVNGYMVSGVTSNDSNSIVIPNSLNIDNEVLPIVAIGNYAFKNCVNMTKVVIPDNVAKIGIDGFYGCSNLDNIVLPNSLYEIEDGVFYECSSITSLKMPNSVKRIGNESFYGCKNLSSVIFSSSIVSIGTDVFFACHSLNGIRIPYGVKHIGEGAFRTCLGLTDILLPNSIVTIGDCAFKGCSKLTTITIPNSVKQMGIQTFSHCKNLTDVHILGNIAKIGQGMFQYYDMLNNVNIPDTVSIIEEDAFLCCKNLINILIPDSVEKIEDGAFAHCTSLKSFVIPSSTKIVDGILYGCTSLIRVTTHNEIISIGSFSECKSLSYFFIPKSVVKIQGRTFGGCSNLKEINYGGTIYDWNLIDKGTYNYYWNADSSIVVVHCLNGDIYV